MITGTHMAMGNHTAIRMSTATSIRPRAKSRTATPTNTIIIQGIPTRIAG